MHEMNNCQHRMVNGVCSLCGGDDRMTAIEAELAALKELSLKAAWRLKSYAEFEKFLYQEEDHDDPDLLQRLNDDVGLAVSIITRWKP